MYELMFNCLGPYDTALMKSLSEIEKKEMEARRAAAYRPLVYICSPYAGDIENNAAKARTFCRFAVVKRAISVATHLLFPQFMSEEKERNLSFIAFLVFRIRRSVFRSIGMTAPLKYPHFKICGIFALESNVDVVFWSCFNYNIQRTKNQHVDI